MLDEETDMAQGRDDGPDEARETTETTVAEGRSFGRLSIALLWGLSPALFLTLSGLFMEWSGDGSQSAGGWLFLLAAVFGGPVLLWLWSYWLVRRTSWGEGWRLLIVFPITGLACAVNFLLGVGTCAVLDPPFNLH